MRALVSPLAQVSDFDLRLLRVFKAVAEAGSFAGAESALGITRSAISLHMADLEQRLGMRLCQRGRAGFALTDQGREVLRSAESLLAAVEDFRTGVNQLHQTLRGDLNIGLMNNLVTLPRMRITAALQAIRQRSYAVRIHLSMSPPGEVERGVLDGRLHAGAVPLITPLSGLAYLPLYDETSQLYCSHGHPLFARAAEVDAAALREAAAVVPTYRMSPEAIVMHQGLNCVASASDREAIAFLILTGQFIGFLPDHYAAAWVAQGQMAALAPADFSAVSTGRPRMARTCSSNSFCHWVHIVTMPVSCGRGLTSLNQT